MMRWRESSEDGPALESRQVERSSRLVTVADMTLPPGLKKISLPIRTTAVFGCSEDMVMVCFVLIDFFALLFSAFAKIM